MQYAVGIPSLIVITARHLAKRAPTAVLLEAGAQAVEPLGHLLAGRARQVLGTSVDLDPR